MREGDIRRFTPVSALFLSLSLFLSCSTSSGVNPSCFDSAAGIRKVDSKPAAGAVPTITSISTQRNTAEGAVQGGTSVFIRGTNFGSDTVVLFADKTSPCVVVQDATFIIAEAGPVFLSGLVSVTVTTGGQIAVEKNGFRYTPLIAFSSNRTGKFEIFTMSIAGFDVKQVTNNALGQQGEPSVENEINASPAFSPDGKDIVYVSNKNGNKDIFIASRTGANPINLTKDNTATNIDPVFSPDGNSIVFASTLDSEDFPNPNEDFEIFRMDRDGNNLIRLTFNSVNDTRPSYSPDGRKIVYASEMSGETDLFIMDSLNGDKSPLTTLTSGPGTDFDPVFSPDGAQVVFARSQGLTTELWVVNSDGTNPIPLTSTGVKTESPVFLPGREDNKVRLLFQQTTSAKSEIVTLTCSGTDFISSCEETSSNSISLHIESDNAPAVSP